jgi:hypothetical protein
MRTCESLAHMLCLPGRSAVGGRKRHGMMGWESREMGKKASVEVEPPCCVGPTPGACLNAVTAGSMSAWSVGAVDSW